MNETRKLNIDRNISSAPISSHCHSATADNYSSPSRFYLVIAIIKNYIIKSKLIMYLVIAIWL